MPKKAKESRIEAKPNTGNRKVYLLLVALVIASFAITWTWLSLPREETYAVNNGVLSYTNRPVVEYGQELLNETDQFYQYKVWFPSHGNVTVYGLLTIPKKDGPLPAFYILPGATVTKEGEQRTLGNALNDLGYVTLILDQRGLEYGETDAIVPTFDYDFTFWEEGYESIQHMMAYDGLRAFDLLNQLPGIDKSRIYAAGESMGGNYAMIDAGIEPRIAGLLLVSSSGYKFEAQNDPTAAEYLKSIVGDTYIPMLSPRPLLMLQSTDDPVVTLAHAEDTFDRAGEPKELLTINSTLHSYGPKMHDILVEGLEGW